MPDAHDEVSGLLADRLQIAKNDADRAEREFAGAQNQLQEARDYLASVESALAHLNTRQRNG